ncbi:MAG: Spy/CpxP family protein refolding chaperone [Deltaproteobacteria bacterium]|nr:Spy/CpxP family protein refolding chaperone [Deltaproteobacteria bacterium]
MKNRIRTSNHFKLLAFLGLVCAGGVGITGCHERSHSLADRIDAIMVKISSRLNLNDSQKMKLDAIKEEILKIRSQHADRRNERFNELLVQVRSDQMDAKWMKQQVETFTETVLLNSDRFIELIADFQKSLQPEQKEALAALLQKHKEKMKAD